MKHRSLAFVWLRSVHVKKAARMWSIAALASSILTVEAQDTTRVISGAINYAGQRDNYTFSVPSPARFYFDSLVNAVNLQWSLSGDPGTVVANRSFASSDAQSIGDPTVMLPAGDYTLTVQGPSAATNAYAFRFIDLSQATPMVPGTPVSAALSPATKTDLYKFSAQAGDRFVFDQVSRIGLQNTLWRLLDPYGNQVFNQGFTDVGTTASPISLPATGQYILLIEGYVADTGSGTYSFNVVPQGNVPPPVFTGTAMSIGNLISGNLAANTNDAYIFTLTNAATLVFDTQLDCPLSWSLQGPSGLVVNQRPFNSSDGGSVQPTLQLPAGGYQLRVTGNSSSAYKFRLIDLASATPITLGTPVSAALNPANATLVYQFTITNPKRVFFNFQGFSGLGNPYWKLVNPYGGFVFNVGLGSDQGPMTLTAAGTYVLLVEGYIYEPGNGNFQFTVSDVGDSTQALAFGSTVNGSIAVAGQRRDYTFTLATDGELYFDSLSNNGNLVWSLDGPTGNAVNRRGFNGSDAQSINNPVLALPAGNYTLSVVGNGDTTADYQFRLLDLATAAPLTLGTPVSGSLNPGNSTLMYKFTINAAQKVFYNHQAWSGLNYTQVRLLDPFWNVVMNGAFYSDQGPFMLNQPGTYTLLVEGTVGDTSNGNIAFNMVPVTDGNQALTLGSLVSGTIQMSGQAQRYTFTLAANSELYFDSLSNNGNLLWSLDGPTGKEVDRRGFNGSDAQGVNYPVLALPAGNYTLTVVGNGDTTADYQFRLLDLATAPPLTLGTPVSGALNPGNSTLMYQFTINAAQKVFYNHQAWSGLNYTQVRLLDPFWNVVMNGAFYSDQGPIMLNQPGTYTLLVEGTIGDTSNGNIAFTMVPVTDGNQALTLGSLVSGTIQMSGQAQRYTFTLAAGSELYFDSLSNNGNLLWSLDGPTGKEVDRRGFNGSDAQGVNYPVLALPAGNYTLTVVGNGDTTADYQFRLLDLATAPPLTLGTPVSGTLNPGNSTLMYQFTINAAQKVFYNHQAWSGLNYTQVRLLDPFWNVVMNGAFYSDQGPFMLNQPGTYTLLVEGTVGDTSNGNIAFTMVPVTDGNQVLTFGATTTGVISNPGQRQQYTFTLAADARLFFDSLTNTCSINWRMDGPLGNVFGGNSTYCFSSDWLQTAQTPILAPGAYTITVAGAADSVGGYAFRLFNLRDSPTLDLNFTNGPTPPLPVSSTVTPANGSVSWKIPIQAGLKLLLKPILQFGFNVQGTPRWLLQDPLGNVLFDNWFTDPGEIQIQVPGDYSLLVYGWISETAASGSVNLQAQLLGNVITNQPGGLPITFGSVASGNVSSSQPVLYGFSITGPKRLMFDSRTFNDQVKWSLSRNGLLLVNSRSFQASDYWDTSDPSLSLQAGDYQLTVSSPAANLQSFAFQLIDFAAATSLTPGTSVFNTLTPANGTALQKFSGVAGDRYFFDGQQSSGFASTPYCRLYSPAGGILWAVNANGSVNTFALPETGTYVLSLEGRANDVGLSGSYAFNLVPANPATNSLTIGDTINGTLATKGLVSYYTFTLPVDSTLYFDALTRADFYWRLDGIWGQAVDWRSFSGSDSQEFVGDPTLHLPAGKYVLGVKGGSNFQFTGDYSFRLLNFTNSTTFNPGTPVPGALNPAIGTVLYKFNGNAGDKYYYDGQQSSGFTYPPYARVYSPYGDIVAFASLNSSANTFTLPVSGTYTVTVEGRIYETQSTGNYAFNLIPITYPTNALTMGNTVSSTLATKGLVSYYTFTLPVDSTLYFDALTRADFYWRLDGIWGQAVDWRSFSGSDSQEFVGDPTLHLPAGNYVLGVKGGSNFQFTGDYSFRLLNFTNSTAFNPGTPVPGALNPAIGTVLYKFNGNAGDKYYYDGQQSSGFTYPPYARVYSPYGDIVAFANLNSSANTFTLPVSGTYTVTVEGRIYETQSTGNYAFNLIPITYPTNALTMGNTVSSTLATKGLVSYYTFTLPVDSTLYFDALTRADFYWRLDGIWGQAVDWRSFSGSDSQEFVGDPTLHLPAGNYVLGVKGGANFQFTGDYSFRLLNFTNSTAFNPGTPVTSTLNPAIGTVLYKFSGNAGDRFYFDGIQSIGFDYAPYCRIYAPAENGFISKEVTGDIDTFTLLQTGTYTLTVEGRIYETKTSGTFAFNLVPNPPVPDKSLYNTNLAPDIALSAPVVNGNVLNFSFLTAANHTYTVQHTAGLEEPVLWQTLNVVIGNNAIFTVTDVIPTTGNRFYRVKAD